MIKIPDTLQEVFDIVSTHLLKQVKRSIAPVGFHQIDTCAYRGRNGMKCAAGALIPDDQYNPKMESFLWDSLVKIGCIEDKFTTEITTLQTIHDTNCNESVDYLKRRLTSFAEIYKLQVNFEV